jgi:WD40 repeat protein
VTFNGHGEPVYAAAFSPDGGEVVTSGHDKQIRVWKVADATQIRAIKGFDAEVFRVIVTPDGRIYSSSADKTARLHNLADGREIKKFGGHHDWVYTVAVDAATKRIATGTYDGEIRLWSSDDGGQQQAWTAAPGYAAADATASAAK